MNWTGGKLQQHSKKDQNSTLHRQKQHFARVRQQLQDPQRAPVSFKPSFLASDDMAVIRQSQLQDFENTAPLARRLASISSHDNSIDSSDRKRKQPRELRDDDITRMLPPQKVTGRQLPTRNQHQPGGNNQGLEHGSEHGKATSPSDDLEDTRRRLLMQSDWLGLKFSKPLRMKFTSTQQEREQFGRRHKIDTQILQAPPNHSRRLRVPSIRGELAGPGRYNSEDLHTQSLKIRIGDDGFSSTRAGSNRKGLIYPFASPEAEDGAVAPGYSLQGQQEDQNDDLSDTQNLLDSASFHGFSDPSSHLRERLSRPATADDHKYRNEEILPYLQHGNSDERPSGVTGRLIFPSSEPATPPALDAQSNVADASVIVNAKGPLLTSNVGSAQERASIVATSNERASQDVSRVKREQLSITSAQDGRFSFVGRDRHIEPQATQEDPHIISSGSSSREESEPPRAAITPDINHAQSPSIQPTASPSTSYRRLTTLAAAPQPTVPGAMEPKKSNAMYSDPDAIWKAFVFGDVSPTRASTAESLPHTQYHDPDSTRANAGHETLNSSLQARAPGSWVTDVADDSSIIDRDPDMLEHDGADARTDVATQLVGQTSSSPNEGNVPNRDPTARKPDLEGMQPMKQIAGSSSPDPLSAPQISRAKNQRILFSRPKKFAVPAAPESVDTGCDVVHLGRRHKSNPRGESSGRKRIMQSSDDEDEITE